MARLFKLSGLAALVLGISTMAYAFTATNTVPFSNAGDGNNTVSGYTISNITYNLASNPANVDSVTFDTAPISPGADPTEVKVTVDGGTTWTNCGPGPTTWTCDFFSDPSVSSISDLRIVAAQ